MKYPNLNEERKIWKKGYSFAFGLDEAGRGPLAGPVVAAAVCLDKNVNLKRNKFFREVNDSKKLTAKKREELYEKITKNLGVKWGIGVVSEKVIDKINILEATKLAMKKAIDNLKIEKGKTYLLLDGNFKLNIDMPQKSIIKGDQKVLSIATASIIAKVYRDKLMIKLHKKYPQYGLDKHKGYGTAHHYQMIKKHGPLVIHRKSFNLFI
jgi:ribonuclease HII